MDEEVKHELRSFLKEVWFVVQDMEVDILEFVVPVENNKTLFVWEIQPSLTEAQIYVSPKSSCFRSGTLTLSPFHSWTCVVFFRTGWWRSSRPSALFTWSR